MSPSAARVAPLRQQLAAYNTLLAAPRGSWAPAQLRRLRAGRDRTLEILRDLARALIAGSWQ